MQRLAFLLLCASILLLTSCSEELYRGLSQRDANEMIAILQAKGISASRESTDGNSFRLMVDQTQFAAAVEILKREGYPREVFRSIGDIFPGDGLITSPYEQRARMTFALNQELARTISEIEGVASARVHVVMPETDLRGSPRGQTSASVVVYTRPGVDQSDLGPKVREIVGKAVPGATYRDVSVAFFHATVNEERPTTNEPPMTATRNGALFPMLSTGFNAFIFLAAFSITIIGARLGLRALRQPAG
jgi:type III secretion protein J